MYYIKILEVFSRIESLFDIYIPCFNNCAISIDRAQSL